MLTAGMRVRFVADRVWYWSGREGVVEYANESDGIFVVRMVGEDGESFCVVAARDEVQPC